MQRPAERGNSQNASQDQAGCNASEKHEQDGYETESHTAWSDCDYADLTRKEDWFVARWKSAYQP